MSSSFFKNCLRAPFRWSFGRRVSQPLYTRLHRLALAGMNCGQGGDLETSGEERVIRQLRRFWTPAESLCFFDVGANKGGYSEQLLHSFRDYPHAHIYAFEPSAPSYQTLSNRLERPIGEGRVFPYPLALGDKPESRSLFSTGSESNSGLTSLYERRLDHHQLTMTKEASIQVQTLDGFCQERAISKIHFLKMDVEGHELAVLRGASGLLLKGAIDVIQFEFGGCNIDSRTFLQDFVYLLGSRYRLYRILRDGLWLIPAYRETDEIFVTTNFLAVLSSYHETFLRH